MAIMGSKNNNRRFPGGKGIRPDHYDFRVSEANARQEAWDALSTQAKIDSLDSRLGPGKGAVRQRARLQDALEKSRASATAESKAPKRDKKEAQAPRYDKTFRDGVKWLNRQ